MRTRFSKHTLLAGSGADMSFAQARGKAARPAFDETRRGGRGCITRNDGSMVPHRKDNVYLTGLLTETALAATMPRYADVADLEKYSLGNSAHTRPLVRVGVLAAQDLRQE